MSLLKSAVMSRPFRFSAKRPAPSQIHRDFPQCDLSSDQTKQRGPTHSFVYLTNVSVLLKVISHLVHVDACQTPMVPAQALTKLFLSAFETPQWMI